MISTRDIAIAAGVDQSTVSRALRNNSEIAPETRKRLQELAKSMGYKPNPVVSAFMSSHRSGKAVTQRAVMAYLTTDAKRDTWKTVHTYRDFFEGAAERAATYGFDLEEFWLREPCMTGRRMSEILFHRNIGGILIAPLRGNSPGMVSGMGHLHLDWQHFSTAALGYTMMRPQVHRAAHNHLHGIRTTLRQLGKLGYRRIGLALHAVHDLRVDQAWSTGFARYLLTQSSSSRTVPFLRHAAQFNYETFIRWFEKQRPDAIIAGNWEIYLWLLKANIGVPKDVGLALLDVPKSAPVIPAGIDQNSKAVAAAAVDMIVGQLNRNERGLPELPKTMLINGSWSPGATLREP